MILEPEDWTISIHFSAKLKTGGRIRRLIKPYDFNPLQREAEDPLGIWYSFPASHFNPLQREAEDVYEYVKYLKQSISIHFSAKLKTWYDEDTKTGDGFQSTSARS